MPLLKFPFQEPQSNHCMDLMGNAEQLGNDAAVRWLGEQAGQTVRLLSSENPTMAARRGKQRCSVQNMII